MPAACGLIVDVMQAKIAHDHIEAPVGERHCLRSLAHQRATPGHAFQFEVVPCCRFRVAAHVHVGPDIEAGRLSAAQPLGRAGKQQPTPAAHIQHLLRAGPLVHFQHKVTVPKLPNLHIQQEQQAFGQQEPTRPLQCAVPEDNSLPEVQSARRDQDEDQRQAAKQEQVAHHVGCVDTIVGLGGELFGHGVLLCVAAEQHP